MDPKHGFMADVLAMAQLLVIVTFVVLLGWAAYSLGERRYQQGRVMGKCEVMASHKTRRTLNQSTYRIREYAAEAADALEEVTGQTCWVVKKRPHQGTQPLNDAYVVIHQDILNGLCLDTDRYVIVYCTDNPTHMEEE